MDNCSVIRGNRRSTRNKTWKKPLEGWIKCNVDGSFDHVSRDSKTGWIYRNNKGFYCGAAQSLGTRVKNAFENELQSILIALQHANNRVLQLWSYKGFY